MTGTTGDRRKVSVSYKEYPSGLHGHSFDLTTIQYGGRNRFEDFLERHGLTEYDRVDLSEESGGSRYQYVWSNPSGTRVVATTNNPISGKYTRPGDREDETGYAGFMSIECADPQVLALMVLDVLDTAEHVKDHGHGFTALHKKSVEVLGL